MYKRISFLSILIIFVATVIAHGPLLFNKGIYWDGWLIYGYSVDHTPELLRKMSEEMGLWIIFYFYNALSVSGIISNYNILAFAFVFLSAVCIYNILRFNVVTSNIDNLAIAILAMAFPAYQVYEQLCTLHYLFCTFLFWLACNLMIIKTESLPWRIVNRVSALLCFFISFETNSLLMFYALPITYLFVIRTNNATVNFIRKIYNFIVYNIDFMVLPFVFFAIKIKYFAPSGEYASYNKIKITFNKIYAIMSLFINVSIIDQINESIHLLLAKPLKAALIIMSLFLCIQYKVLRPKTHPIAKQSFRDGIVLAGFAALGFVCAAFPYAAVGDAPLAMGVASRHALLIGLPAALSILAALRLFGSLASYQNESHAPIIGTTSYILCLLCLFFAFSIKNFENYQDRQITQIKRDAIQMALRQTPALKDFSLYRITDVFPYDRLKDNEFYAWTWMFKQVWGEESRLALETKEYPEIEPTRSRLPASPRLFLSDFDRSGAMVSFRIEKGRLDLTPWQIYRDFLLTRLLIRKSRYQPADLLHITVTDRHIVSRDCDPVSSATTDPTNCLVTSQQGQMP